MPTKNRTNEEQLVEEIPASKGEDARECGPCGYVLHRQLAQAGAIRHKVKARDLTDGRGQKTDGLDAVALANNLDRYTRGHARAMIVVRAPSEQEEIARAGAFA